MKNSKLDCLSEIRNELSHSSKIFKNVDVKKLINIVNLIKKTISKNGAIFVCGNGGSASTANHMVCDFLKRVKYKNKHTRIFSLNSNFELLTAISNDISFDNIFSFQIDKICSKDDLLIMFSVSGNSKNLLKAASLANRKKIKTISFTGSNGGKLKKNSFLNLNINSLNYGIVEDAHLMIMHNISDAIINKKNLIKVNQ